MKIGTYISELLFDHEHVILPGFGEFSTKYIPARFIPEEKKILSPSKIISFSNEKTEGDTPLISHIAQKENLSMEEVQKYIADFVSEINSSLAGGQKVMLDHVGVFSRDAAGNILFDPDRSINYLSDAAGMGAVSEPPKATTKPVVPLTPEPVIEKIPEPVFEEKPEPEPEPKAEQVSEPSQVAGSQPVEEPEPHLAYAEAPNQDLPKAVKWLAWFFIPVVVIVIILAFNWKFIFGKKSQPPASIPKTEVVAPAPAPEQTAETPATLVEESPATKTPEAPAAQVATQPEAGRRVYYIVVGAFQDQRQANRYVEELRAKGASQASIFMQTNTGYHRVCYGFYYDQAEAETQLKRVQQEINPSAWILQRN